MNQELICNRNYVLKKVLSNDNYKNIIKDIIQSILEIEIKSIKINSYIDTLEKYIPAYEKMGILDVRVTTSRDEELNIGIEQLKKELEKANDEIDQNQAKLAEKDKQIEKDEKINKEWSESNKELEKENESLKMDLQKVQSKKWFQFWKQKKEEIL